MPLGLPNSLTRLRCHALSLRSPASYTLSAPGDEFYVPAAVYWTAWFLMAAGYTFSGIVKLSSPSWQDGTALWHVLQNPLARDGWLRDLAVAMPMWVFKAMTWQALALEILFLPLAVWRWTRPLIWLAMVGMHVGIVALVTFADLSAGILMLHLFTLDARWLGMARTLRDRFRQRHPRSSALAGGEAG